MLRNWLLTLWLDPVYAIIMVVIGIELVIAMVQILWLLYQTVNARYLERKAAQFGRELEPVFADALATKEGISSWVKRARAYPVPIVRTFLDGRLQTAEAKERRKIVRIYRSVGLLALDVKYSRSRFWHKRMLAMRRLSLVATEDEIQILLARKRDRHSVRILAAQILARIGTSFDVFVLLRNMHIPRRLMEQPVLMLLDELTFKKLDVLLENYHKFASQKVQQLLLVTAARKDPATCLHLLPKAFRDEGIEVRIGACIAAGVIRTGDVTPLLLDAARDTSWEVRAQAVKALGEFKDPALLDALVASLKDHSFWVRQNAAASITMMGEPGLKRLMELSEHAEDRFARDSARQEL